MKQKELKMQKLLHALGTSQILLDELYNIKNEAKLGKVDFFVHDLKKATNHFVNNGLRVANMTLNQVWAHIPNEDFDEYLEAKRELIDLIQQSTFEDIKQLSLQIKDVHYKYKQIDLIERILNTHCVEGIREMYRNEFGYTLEQYKEMKRLQEEGFIPTYQ